MGLRDFLLFLFILIVVSWFVPMGRPYRGVSAPVGIVILLVVLFLFFR